MEEMLLVVLKLSPQNPTNSRYAMFVCAESDLKNLGLTQTIYFSTTEELRKFIETSGALREANWPELERNLKQGDSYGTPISRESARRMGFKV